MRKLAIPYVVYTTSLSMAAAATQAISIVSVFLSYSDKDRARAGRIAEAFNSHGIDCFFAFRDEKPLQEWEGRISREILERRLFILLYTTNSRISAQVRKELDQAQVAHKEIWMIKDTDAGIVGFITDYAVNAKHAFDICEQSEDECVSKVLKAIHERWLGPNGEVRTDNCPYPGTQSFRRPDPQFPFARHDSALADLKHLISDRWDAASRLVLVHGPSGAGKTSLLRAGLKQELSSSDIFYDEVIDAMDGKSFVVLLKAILTQLTGSTNSVDYARLLGMQFLDHNALLAGILESIRSHRQNRFVFCFDQMEEFFGEKINADDVQEFLTCMQRVVKEFPSVTVLISFRKEAFTDVRREVRQRFGDDWSEVEVRKFTGENARLAIIGPAEARGVRFDSNLAKEIVLALADDHGGGLVVNPIDIQKVCKELWFQTANLKTHRSDIDVKTFADVRVNQKALSASGAASLSDSVRLHKEVRGFVVTVLRNYLEEAIAKIQKDMPCEFAGANPHEQIVGALNEIFVAGNSRRKVPLNPGRLMVGLWPEAALEDFVTHGIVERTREGYILSDIEDPAAGVHRYSVRFPARLKEIAAQLGDEDVSLDTEERVMRALYATFRRDEHRVPVPARIQPPRVGRLPLTVVEVFVKAGLVQSCGIDNEYFELTHDSLADDIRQLGEDSLQVQTLNRFNDLRSRELKDGKNAFNQNVELLGQMEQVRDNNRVFEADELESLVRWGLGDKRKNIQAVQINLEKWVQLLSETSGSRLVRVIEDALSDTEESVQLDVLELMTSNSSVQNALRSQRAASGLTSQRGAVEINLQRMAMGKNCAVQRKACAALVQMDAEQSIQQTFADVRQSSSSEGRSAIGFFKHAIDTGEGRGTPFAEEWKKLRLLERFRIRWGLYRWRWSEAQAWVFYLTALASPFAALGAALPFVPVGVFAASLTLGTPRLGWAAGIFHGVTGGFVWGFSVTFALLLYCIVWRGGRLQPTIRGTLAACVWSGLGAGLGGFCNAAIIGLVFARAGLYQMGWLDWGATDNLHQTFVHTLNGWSMPIYGVGLGVGIGWSLMHILTDSRETWRGQGNPFSGHLAASARRVMRVVFSNSWRNVLVLAVAGLAVGMLVRPGDGVCDATFHANVDLSKVCDAVIPSKWIRTAGLGLVILGGSLFQETAFLFGLLCVQHGVKLGRNDSFLRAVKR